MNKVGTFGVGSAAYWWSRVFSAIARLSLYITGRGPVWQLVFADDIEWVVSGPGMFEELALIIFWQVLMGVPFAWHKFGGGSELDWVGYYLDYRRFAVGISEGRSRWMETWLRDTLAAGGVRVQECEEVLGRLGFCVECIIAYTTLVGATLCLGVSHSI